MTSKKMVKCECEHSAHFHKDKLTPNGNPGHKYGQEFAVSYTRKTMTHWGTFTVCLDCYKDCLVTFSKEE